MSQEITSPYNYILKCNNTTSKEYCRRLNSLLNHMLSPNPIINKEQKRLRLQCILCCWKCEKGDKTHKSRQGKTTTKICVVCKVTICVHCFPIFHSQDTLPLPACMEKRQDELKCKEVILYRNKNGKNGKR